eukprot:1253004-Prymnesium_polylepis.1
MKRGAGSTLVRKSSTGRYYLTRLLDLAAPTWRFRSGDTHCGGPAVSAPCTWPTSRVNSGRSDGDGYRRGADLRRGRRS